MIGFSADAVGISWAKLYPTLMQFFYFTKIDSEKAKINQRVAHNIRHPLAALNGLIRRASTELSPADLGDFKSCATNLTQTACAKDGKLAKKLILVDNFFPKTEVTGLEIIEKYEIQSHCYLATHQVEDPELIREARLIGVKIIPKIMAPVIQLVTDKQSDTYGKSPLRKRKFAAKYFLPCGTSTKNSP